MKSFYSINLDVQMGAVIGNVIEDAIAIAKFTNDTVSFTFNGVNLRVLPDSDPADIYVKYIRRQ